MKTPELSQRLMSAVGFVRGGFLADVGTDHAHLPVYLYQLGKIRGAVASDVNEGPLARAKANIAAYGAEKGIATELSDGLARLAPYQPDDIVIFGMGGELIIRIIEDADWVKRYSAKIVYVPDAVVEHSHNYTLAEVKKRFYNEGVADTQMGKKPMTFFHCVRTITAETLRDWMYLIKHGTFKEFFYAPVYRYVQKMSYYRGANQ